MRRRLLHPLTAAIVKVFGCRPLTDGAANSGGRRAKTSKGGNRGKPSKQTLQSYDASSAERYGTLSRERFSPLTQRRHAATRYSMTSSARPDNGSGNVNPSVVAVLRLITNSTVVDCWTGNSAGLAPLRILPV
jgi:hypothetical protein